jgi:predicted NUDIX family phosphoesterase
MKSETVVVFEKKQFLKEGHYFEGIEPFLKSMTDFIGQNFSIKNRPAIETDESYIQVVCYVVARVKDGSFFLMQRKKACSEKRLSSSYSLGIGGHLQECDIVQEGALKGVNLWPVRELDEEVSLPVSCSLTPSFMIYDPTNPVGRVHCGIGYVFSLCDDHRDKLAIKSELRSGMFTSVEEIKKKYYDSLEPWSKLSLSFLEKGE